MDPEQTQHDAVQKDCLYRLAQSFTSVVQVHPGDVQDKEAEDEPPYVTGSAKHSTAAQRGHDPSLCSTQQSAKILRVAAMAL